jgi:hypothetical protein
MPKRNYENEGSDNYSSDDFHGVRIDLWLMKTLVIDTGNLIPRGVCTSGVTIFVLTALASCDGINLRLFRTGSHLICKIVHGSHYHAVESNRFQHNLFPSTFF